MRVRVQNDETIEPGTRVLRMYGQVVYEVVDTRRNSGGFQLARLLDPRSGKSAGWHWVGGFSRVEREP